MSEKLSMDVRVTDEGACRKVVRVTAPAEAVLPDYREVVKAFADVAKVPGFRPGKAPVDVVERRYEKRIVENVTERLLPRLYHDALKQEAIEPVAVLGVSDVRVSKDNGVDFNITVDVAPDFKLPRYRKIPLKGAGVKVEEADVDAALERLRGSLARYEDVTDRPAGENDLVRVDYAGEIEGGPVSGMAPDCSGLGEGKDFWIPLGEKEFLPGFNDGLMGIGLGEEREIAAHFPSDYHVAAVAGKDAVYKVTAKGIRKKILPEIDADFLEKVKADSPENLREKIRSDLIRMAEENEKAKLKKEIAAHLLKNTSFELPRSIVEEETKTAISGIVRNISMQGATKEQIEAQKSNIVSAATETAADRVKLLYILDRIASETGITVEDRDIEDRVAALAAHYQMPAARLKSEMEKGNGLKHLKSEMQGEKVLDHLLLQAKIKK